MYFFSLSCQERGRGEVNRRGAENYLLKFTALFFQRNHLSNIFVTINFKAYSNDTVGR
jgi:competence protein ComGF